MKKLIASILFFGSFGVAMAQSPISSTGLWRDFYSLFRRAAPVMPVVMPNAVKTFNAVVSAARTVVQATGDQRYCRNADPVSASYCNDGRDEDMGGDGTRCSQLPGCIGTTDNLMNQCRPAPRCTSSIPPLKITVMVNSVSCTKPDQNTSNQCEKYKTGMSGLPTDEERAIMMKRYEICLRDLAYIMQRPGSANGSVSITITGGSEAPYSGTHSVGAPLFSPYLSANGFVTVRGQNIPVTLICPAVRPQQSECSILITRYKTIVASGEMTIEQMNEKCKSAKCWVESPAVGGGSCGDPHPYQ